MKRGSILAATLGLAAFLGCKSELGFESIPPPAQVSAFCDNDDLRLQVSFSPVTGASGYGVFVNGDYYYVESTLRAANLETGILEDTALLVEMVSGVGNRESVHTSPLEVTCTGGSPLSLLPFWSANGDAPNDDFGTALATGDLDGDGFVDLAVGAPGYSNGLGRVSVFYGAQGGFDLLGVHYYGSAPNGEFGAAVAIGDVDIAPNGDLLVGAPGENRVYRFNSGGGPPYVYVPAAGGGRFGAAVAIAKVAGGGDDVVVGAPTAQAGNGTVTLFDGDSELWTEVGSAESGFGAVVAAGNVLDVAGDDRDEILIGAPLDDAAGTDSGRVLVAAGAAAPPTKVSIPGNEAGAEFGSSLATVDFDGTGVRALVIGVRRAEVDGNPNDRPGNIRVVALAPSPSPSPTSVLTFQIDAALPDGETGTAVASMSLGGVPSVVAGSAGWDDYLDGERTGEFGGRVDLVQRVGGALQTAGGLPYGLRGPPLDRYGSALAVADVNGDGRDDLVIGAPGSTGLPGSVYVQIAYPPGGTKPQTPLVWAGLPIFSHVFTDVSPAFAGFQDDPAYAGRHQCRLTWGDGAVEYIDDCTTQKIAMASHQYEVPNDPDDPGNPYYELRILVEMGGRRAEALTRVVILP